MRHNLYVKVANDSLSYQLTLEILQYVQKNMNILKKMEVELHVVKLTFDELENTAVQQSLLQRGITKLPALTTSQNIYLGNTEIINIYEKNIKDYLAATSAPQSKNNIHEEDDDFLDSFMKKEINTKENDYAGDDDMNDSSGSSLMQDYQRKMDQRKNMMPAMPNQQPHQPQMPPQPQPRQQQQQQPQPQHQQRQPPPQSSQANDIEETLKKLQNDIDNNLQMDDADVEYEKNPNDDIMERALWNRIDLND